MGLEPRRTIECHWIGLRPRVRWNPWRVRLTRTKQPRQMSFLHFSTVLQAGDEREFNMLPSSMLRGLEERFVRKNGGHARDSEGTVTEQLSSLASRLASDEAPYGDFSVFSLFRKRAMKLMTFLAKIFVGGELTTKTAAVPPRFCAVAKMLACVLDNHAEIGRLATRPTGHLRGEHPTAPQHCGHLSVVEDQIRSEGWEILTGEWNRWYKNHSSRGVEIPTGHGQL